MPSTKAFMATYIKPVLYKGNAVVPSSVDKTQSVIRMIHSIYRDEKFDAVKMAITPDEFLALGFEYGDSCTVKFSNCYTLHDVPVFSSYYVKTGYPVIIARPGNNYVKIALNSCSLWTPAGLTSDCTVEITLDVHGKYIAVHEALGQTYSNDRRDFISDAQFANFRPLTGGNLKKYFLYRGVSPVDNQKGRAPYANALIKEAGIKCIIDLADSEKDMQKHLNSEGFSSEYAKELYESGRTVLLSLSTSYDTDYYRERLATGFRHLIKFGGPAYVHCLEGKDRTGFVCTVLEALAGATYSELCDDYMITYDNYYGITRDGTPVSYDIVVDYNLDVYASHIYGSSDPSVFKFADYTQAAQQYLMRCGMSESEVDQLVKLITK